MKKYLLFFWLFFLIANPAFATPFGLIDTIKPEDRILILAPHPDDEAIGCAGIIQQALSVGADVHVAYLTNGDHNEIAFIVYEKRLVIRKGEFIHMGKQRRREAITAMKFLGLKENDLTFLGYPDFGTFSILRSYWKKDLPYRSILTRINKVPYKENLSYNALYVGQNILHDLKQVINSFRPNKIFVTHPADVNVDHKALYLFLEIALADLRNVISRPIIYPYLIHYLKWPVPRHYHPELELDAPEVFTGKDISWYKYYLSPLQLKHKLRAILLYPSQTRVSAFYLLTFARRNELFGVLPEVELGLIPEEAKEEKKNLVQAFLAHFKKEKFDEIKEVTVCSGRLSYLLEDRHFLIKIKKEENISRRFGTNIYIFPYSYKTPFELMPKLYISTMYKSVNVKNGAKNIIPEGITMDVGKKEAILKVPLDLLKNPDFLLISVKVEPGNWQAEGSAFRKVVIRKAE